MSLKMTRTVSVGQRRVEIGNCDEITHYYPVQTQMMVYKGSYCDCVVRTEKELSVERNVADRVVQPCRAHFVY